MVSCVGFARIPLSFNFRHTSYADMLPNPGRFISIAFSRPLPLTSLITVGCDFCTAKSSSLNSSPISVALSFDENYFCPEQRKATFVQKQTHLSASFSSLMTSNAAIPTALAKGFPPNVLKVWTIL